MTAQKQTKPTTSKAIYLRHDGLAVIELPEKPMYCQDFKSTWCLQSCNCLVAEKKYNDAFEQAKKESILFREEDQNRALELVWNSHPEHTLLGRPLKENTIYPSVELGQIELLEQYEANGKWFDLKNGGNDDERIPIDPYRQVYRFVEEPASEQLICGICNESYNPANLSSVLMHTHSGLEESSANVLGIKGKRVESKPADLEEKKDLVKFLQERIATAFRSMENGVLSGAAQSYPFDEHSIEEILGMKRAYSDVLTEVQKVVDKKETVEGESKCDCDDCNHTTVELSAAVLFYMAKVGGHDRPWITRHDFIQGYKAAKSSSPQEVKPETEKREAKQESGEKVLTDDQQKRLRKVIRNTVVAMIGTRPYFSITYEKLDTIIRESVAEGDKQDGKNLSELSEKEAHELGAWELWHNMYEMPESWQVQFYYFNVIQNLVQAGYSIT